ncbi:MAG: ABC transporter permease [Rhodobacteraceae bacterium PARR1]|nr:MAG: ABC transporter permease [Rhodobacteraceae bacterium PARR1]
MLTLTSPRETPLHGWPAGVKLAGLCLFTLALFQLTAPLWLVGVAVALALGHLALGRDIAAAGFGLLRPLWPFALIVTVWHLILHDPSGGAVILLRMGSAVAAANLVTMTTRLSDMLAVLMRLVAPLSRLGLPGDRIALAVALVIRFIPVLSDRIALIRSAWFARSLRPPGWRLLVPAALAALDEAEHVAESLRARGGAG